MARVRFASPRLRGEVGLRSNPGEEDSPRVPLRRQPLTPTLSPQERGEGDARAFRATPRYTLAVRPAVHADRLPAPQFRGLQHRRVDATDRPHALQHE